jgi:hypothetical protein
MVRFASLMVAAIFVAGVFLGGFLGYNYHRNKYPPPPPPNVHLIGTSNYTAVDARDASAIIFYVNTNCPSTK